MTEPVRALGIIDRLEGDFVGIRVPAPFLGGRRDVETVYAANDPVVGNGRQPCVRGS